MRTLLVTPVLSVDAGKPLNHYLIAYRKLEETYLKHTDFDILTVTNFEDLLNSKNNPRVKHIDISRISQEPLISGNRNLFNMHLKRLPIKEGMKSDYDLVYFHDCDCWINGWDAVSFEKLVARESDIFFPTRHHPQLGGLRKTYQHFQDKLDTEYKNLYKPEFDSAPNAAETRIIFKNNSKLKSFIEFWDKVAAANNNFDTYHSGVYFGTSAIEAKMKLDSVTPDDEFAKFCRITHGSALLDYHGRRL